MGPHPLLSCSAEPLPSEITGTCTGEVAAGGPSGEPRRPRNVPLVREGVLGEVEHSLPFWQHWTATEGGGGSVGRSWAAPFLFLYAPHLPHGLILKSPFLSDKPQNF